MEPEGELYSLINANVGLLSCIAQKNDTVFYDQLCHASIRDGIRLSFAQSFSFAHNDIHELEKVLIKLLPRFLTGES